MRVSHTSETHTMPPLWRWYEVEPAGVPQPGGTERKQLTVRQLQRQIKLDALFEKLMRAYRQTLLAAIDKEPHGPCRYLRGHISGLAEVVWNGGHAVSLAARLMQHKRYQRVWIDFVAEACANDFEDCGLADITLHTANSRLLAEVQQSYVPRRGTAAGVRGVSTISIQCDLLSLCSLSARSHSTSEFPRSTSLVSDEPYCTH